MIRKSIIIVMIFCGFLVHAQDDWMVKGYVKGLAAMQTIGDNGEIALENTIHNRFDINWYISNKFTFSAGLRNRIIIGNNVSLIPDYADYISRDPGYFDLSWVWADNTSWIGVSQFDRLMIDYTSGKLQVTVGRQRINWGQTFVWNPNDLFNTYSYFDFDYEEKPGSDAIRLQYYLGESSKLELSTSLNSESEITSVLLYRFNTKGRTCRRRNYRTPSFCPAPGGFRPGENHERCVSQIPWAWQAGRCTRCLGPYGRYY